MAEDSFFDTNVIVNYASYYQSGKNKLNEKCHDYIQNKVAKFIICYFVQKEISNFITKRSLLHKEVLNKIEDVSYLIENSKSLSKKDIPYAKKLYEFYKNKDIKQVYKILTEERKRIEIKIEQFLKTKLDEVVIPINEIDINLVRLINDIISNYADCNILASALQLRKDRSDFLFVTVDGKDLDPNGYDFLKDHSTLKDCKFPKLKNLLFE